MRRANLISGLRPRSNRLPGLCRLAYLVLVFIAPWPPASLAAVPQDQSEKQESAGPLSYVNQGPAKCTEIGNFYLKRKNYRAAISRFQEAADTDPNYAPAYLGLGKAYEKLGQNQKALESYRKYLDMLPSDKDADSARDVQRAIEQLTAGKRAH